MTRWIRRASVVALLLALLAWPAGGNAAPAGQAGALAPSAPPAGTEALNAAWYTVIAPDGRAMVVAVYDPRPSRDQPAPSILVLHGNDGFSTEYVQIARALAEQTGFVVAAGCWFGGAGAALNVSDSVQTAESTRIECPGGPEFVGATPAAWPAVASLSQAVRQYAGGAGFGLFGHSRGAEVALQVASSPEMGGLGVQAVVAASGVYSAAPSTASFDTPSPLSLAESLSAPVLILHGQADTVTHLANATIYAQRLLRLNTPVQCALYPRAEHNAILHATSSDAQEGRVFTDAMQRSAAFFRGAFAVPPSVPSSECAPV
jgi:dienelactone hydrolase